MRLFMGGGGDCVGVTAPVQSCVCEVGGGCVCVGPSVSEGVVLRVGLFASGIVAVGAVHGGGVHLCREGRGSAEGGGVCLRAILPGAVFCVRV